MAPSTLIRAVRPRHRRRRRFRTRLLLAMLLVGLLPLSLLAIIVVADLGAVSRTTADEAGRTLIEAQESDQQRQVDDRGRVLQGAIDAAVNQLQGLRQHVAALLHGRPVAGAAPAPVPQLATLAGLRYLHSPSASGTMSTLLAAPIPAPGAAPPTGPDPSARPVPATGAAASADAALADAATVTAAAEPAMEALRNVAGVRAVWIADTAAGVVRTLPDLDVGAAIASGTISAGALLSTDGAPFSALTRHAGDAVSNQSTWEGEAVSPNDIGARPTFSATYATAAPDGIGVTAWQPVATGSHDIVGIDLDVRQLVAGVGDTPVSDRPGASTMLVGGGAQVLGASPTAVSALHLPAHYPGTPLAAASPPLRAGLAEVLATGNGRTLQATVGTEDDKLFTTSIRAAHWVLVSSVPRRELVPDQAALTRGVTSGVHHILVGLIPITLGAVLLAALLAGLAARRAVGPLRALSLAAERLGAGDTHVPVPPQGRDEFGLLALSLERMRREVNASRDAILAAARELEKRVEDRTSELRMRNEELVAINRLAGSLTRSLDPETILAGCLESLDALVPLRGGRGFVFDDGRLRGLAVRGATDDDGPALTGIANAAMAKHDLASRKDGEALLVGLPLETHDGPLGAIGLRVDARWEATDRGRALLRAVADQVGLALRTALLSAEGRELAVLEERTRLAREIHDTLAQQLTGIILQLESAEALAARDGGRTRDLVVAARDQARFALQEARRSVWNLRPQPLDATGLAGAVRAEVSRFARRTGIDARVTGVPLPLDIAISPQAEVALFRILQEALTNAGRHSGATSVEVTLHTEGDELVLSVSDDGSGFPSTATPTPGAPSFGLVGMQERARLAGAALRIESEPGAGTRVDVRLALVAPVPAGHAATTL